MFRFVFLLMNYFFNTNLVRAAEDKITVQCIDEAKAAGNGTRWTSDYHTSESKRATHRLHRAPTADTGRGLLKMLYIDARLKPVTRRRSPHGDELHNIQTLCIGSAKTVIY